MTLPTIGETIAWGLVIGVGAAVAVGSFLFLCALFGIEWCDDKEHKA